MAAGTGQFKGACGALDDFGGCPAVHRDPATGVHSGDSKPPKDGQAAGC